MTSEEERLSRAVSACVGFDPEEMFCAAVYRRRWTSLRWFMVWMALDLHFWTERGERRHCRARWLEHERRDDAERLIGVGTATEAVEGTIQRHERFSGAGSRTLSDAVVRLAHEGERDVS